MLIYIQPGRTLMINIEHAKNAFNKFIQQFNVDDPKISLKIRHTYYVMDACEYLAREMKLDKTNYDLAVLIGLLHDIGRFEQLKLFNSYDDNLICHAKCGIEVLFEQGHIRDFIDTDKYDNIIYQAIKNHSAYAIAPGLSEQELLHAKLIRDADKMDNYRVKRDDTIEALLDMSAKELGTYKISDHIFETFASHKTILKNDRKTPMDMWVSFLALFFDFNYAPSFKFILENDYINAIIDRIPYSNPDTATKMNEIKKIAINFCLNNYK